MDHFLLLGQFTHKLEDGLSKFISRLESILLTARWPSSLGTLHTLHVVISLLLVAIVVIVTILSSLVNHHLVVLR